MVSIANPDATAHEAVTLLKDEGRWRAAQEAGIRRVERFYTQRDMIENYRRIYREAMERQATPPKKAEVANSAAGRAEARAAQ